MVKTDHDINTSAAVVSVKIGYLLPGSDQSDIILVVQLLLVFLRHVIELTGHSKPDLPETCLAERHVNSRILSKNEFVRAIKRGHKPV